MQNSEIKNLEEIISKLDNKRAWLLKKIDSGRWSEVRNELAELERELSKFILRAKEYNSENK